MFYFENLPILKQILAKSSVIFQGLHHISHLSANIFLEFVYFSAETWGVVTMGDCASGPAFAIWVDNHRVQAHIELMNGFNIVDHVITSDAVSFLYIIK